MSVVRIIPIDDPTPIELSEKAVNCLESIKTAVAITEGDINVPISRQIIFKVLEFMEINNFEKVNFPVVTSNKLENTFQGDLKNYKYLCTLKKNPENFEGKDFGLAPDVFKAASYFQYQSLKSLIGCYISTLIYFKNQNNDYAIVKQKLGVKEDATVQELQMYKIKYHTL